MDEEDDSPVDSYIEGKVEEHSIKNDGMRNAMGLLTVGSSVPTYIITADIIDDIEVYNRAAEKALEGGITSAERNILNTLKNDIKPFGSGKLEEYKSSLERKIETAKYEEGSSPRYTSAVEKDLEQMKSIKPLVTWSGYGLATTLLITGAAILYANNYKES